MSPAIQRVIFSLIMIIATSMIYVTLRSRSTLIKCIVRVAVIGTLAYIATSITSRHHPDAIDTIISTILHYRPYIQVFLILAQASTYINGKGGKIIARLISAIVAVTGLIGLIATEKLDILFSSSKTQISIHQCGDDICQADEQCGTCSFDCGPCFQERSPPPTPQYGLSCGLPRGGQLTDGFGTYAFRNRTDNPSLCDIQLRMCQNGDLSGSYTQPYCRPKAEKFINTTPPVVISNTPNPLTQPIQPNNLALYDNQGHIIPPEDFQPIVIPDIPYQQPPIAENQIQTKTDCISPRGQTVPHGTFVTAYQFPEGYNDQPCSNQLRTCSDGLLLGQYLYPECHPIDRFAEARARTEKTFFDPLPPGTRDIINNVHIDQNGIFIE